MDHPGDFTSDAFEFMHGGVISVQARPSPSSARGGVEFCIEGSRDKACWAQLLARSVSDGERAEIPCQDRLPHWGRIRIRTFGGDASVNVRRFREGNG